MHSLVAPAASRGGSRSPFGLLRMGLAAAAIVTVAGCSAGTIPGAPPLRSMPAARVSLLPEYRLFYDALVDYGDWVLVEPRGFVFRPRVDPLWWRPYYDGYWAPTDTYGWVWNSADPFGWATDHYGRWLYDEFQGWVWTPGLEWGPAWVEWQMGGDYVSWAPLPPAGSAWSERIPNGPFLYASTADLAHGDLRARARTAREVGGAAMRMEPLDRVAVRDGVRIPLGPPIERVERAYGFPIPRARLEELIPAGAATLPQPETASVADSAREPVLTVPLGEIRRAGEMAARDNRDVTGRQSPPPLRVPVVRAFAPPPRDEAAGRGAGAVKPKSAAADTTRAKR